jgi:hypothetical protein
MCHPTTRKNPVVAVPKKPADRGCNFAMSISRIRQLLSRRLFLALGLCGIALPTYAAPKRWRFLTPVTITADDIAWFRTAQSIWLDVESGAPAMIPAGVRDKYVEADELNANPYFRRLEPIACAFFLHATFVPGDYALATKPDGRARFIVTTEHIRLLQITNWRTFAIDGKRPYGDFTNFPIDMARRLGLTITPSPKGYSEISKADEARMEVLHQEMLFVVQAFIEHAQLAPGAYAIPYDGWNGHVLPRCAPVPATQLDAYKQDMAKVMAKADGSSLFAGASLFDVP